MPLNKDFSSLSTLTKPTSTGMVRTDVLAIFLILGGQFHMDFFYQFLFPPLFCSCISFKAVYGMTISLTFHMDTLLLVY